MFRIPVKTMTLFILFFSNPIVAHPHHSEVEMTILHELLHSPNESVLYIILLLGVSLFIFRVFKSLNGAESSHK